MRSPCGRLTPVLVLLCLAANGLTRAQDDIAAAQRLQQQANRAYQEGDYAAFSEALEQALKLNPASFFTRYNLACGYARTGRDDAAMALLAELAAARVDFGMSQDPDFASLRERADFRQMLQELERKLVPVSNSTHVLTVEQVGIIPEGIASDPDTGRMFLGSMRTGEIYAVDDAGVLSRFATVEYEGTLSAIGLEVDTKRHLLWAVGSSFFMAEDFDPERPARTGVFGYDLTTGELKRQHVLVGGEARGFNDLTVAPSGEVYASGGPLSRIPADGGKPRPLELDPPMAGTNGITLTPDGKALYVSVYPAGLAVIDLSTLHWRFVDHPADTPLIGIDGLYWYDGDLVGIQNGIQPWRLLRLELNEDGTAVTRVHVIEFANAELTATTGTIRDGEIYYVGQAPAPEQAPPQFPAALAPFLGKPVVMKAPLR